MDVKRLLAAAGVACACTVPDPSYMPPGTDGTGASSGAEGEGDTEASGETNVEASSGSASEASSSDAGETDSDASGTGETSSSSADEGDAGTTDGGEPFEHTSRDCADAAPSVSMADLQAIFDLHCVECHSPPGTPHGLDLTPSAAWDSLVNQTAGNCGKIRVIPDDPAASYLLDKLEDIDLCSGTPMPKNRAPLTIDERNIIQSWICAGAPAQ